jgi:hypothetical protein
MAHHNLLRISLSTTGQTSASLFTQSSWAILTADASHTDPADRMLLSAAKMLSKSAACACVVVMSYDHGVSACVAISKKAIPCEEPVASDSDPHASTAKNSPIHSRETPRKLLDVYTSSTSCWKIGQCKAGYAPWIESRYDLDMCANVALGGSSGRPELPSTRVPVRM